MAKAVKKPDVTFPTRGPLPIWVQIDEARTEKEIKKQVREDMERLVKLGAYYGIEEDSFDMLTYELCLAMARILYPEPKSPGAKKKWGMVEIGYLVVEMEREIVHGVSTKGITYAARKLANREPWKSFLKAHGTVGTLERRAEVLRTKYTKHKRDRWAGVTRNAFKNHIADGRSIEDWEQQVREDVRKSPNN
ncbi:MAG: hypothetical protein ACK5XE_10580 [Burkholderiales bacterium]